MNGGNKSIDALQAELEVIEAEEVHSIKDIFNKMQRIASVRKLINEKRKDT